MVTIIITYFCDVDIFIISMYYFCKRNIYTHTCINFETTFGNRKGNIYVKFEILYKSFQKDLWFVT